MSDREYGLSATANGDPATVHPAARAMAVPSRALLDVCFVLRKPATSPPIARAASEDEAVAAARVLKALADPARFWLVTMIGSRPGGEVCVCDLSGPFEQAEVPIGHHLRALRDSGLIARERRGPWDYYRLVPSLLDEICALLGPPDLPQEQA